MTLFGETVWTLRSLRRDLAFAVTFVAVFAIGLGAGTAVVAATRAIYGERLPGTGALTLVRIYTGNAGAPAASPERFGRSSMPEIRAYARDSAVFRAVIATNNFSATVGVGERRLAATGSLVSGNYFSVLHQRAQLGRLIDPDDDAARGRATVVVLSDAFWHAYFGGRRSAVGAVLRVNGYPFTVVGVAAPDFRGTAFDYTPGFWVPIAAQSEAYGSPWVVDYPDAWMFDTFALLQPGITPVRADGALQSLKRGLHARGDDWYDQRVATVDRASTSLGAFDRLRPLVDRVSWLVGAVAVLLILVVTANLANVLLARRFARHQQIAIQLALGATRGRLVRQQAIETLILAFPAVGAGIVLAWGLCRGVAALSFMHFPTIRLSAPLAAGAAATGLVSAALMGIALAWRAPAPLTGLARGRMGATGRAAGRVRRSFMIAQVALAFVVVLMAALLQRSAHALASMNPGYDVADVLTGRVYLWNRAGFNAGSIAQYDEFMRRLRLDPQVVGASSDYTQLLSGYESRTAVSVPGRAQISGQDSVVASATVGLQYFATLGIPILEGREFDLRDTVGAPGAVVVNRAAARKFWSGGSALGRVVLHAGHRFAVVGVVGDAAAQDLDAPHVPRVYFALRAQGFAPPHQTLFIRVRGSADAAGLARTIQRIAPGPARVELRTLGSIRDDQLAPLNALGDLVASIAIVETLLAALGLAGLMTYLVGQRLREISIRLALGAERRSIFWLLLRDAARSVLAGAVLGALLWGGAARLVSSFLAGGMGTIDPVSVAASLVTVMTATLGLAALPCLSGSRRAPVLPGE